MSAKKQKMFWEMGEKYAKKVGYSVTKQGKIMWGEKAATIGGLTEARDYRRAKVKKHAERKIKRRDIQLKAYKEASSRSQQQSGPQLKRVGTSSIGHGQLQGDFTSTGSYQTSHPNAKMFLNQKNPRVPNSKLNVHATNGMHVDPNKIDTSFARPVSDAIRSNYQGKSGYIHRARHGANTFNPIPINRRRTVHDEGAPLTNTFGTSKMSHSRSRPVQAQHSFIDDYYQQKSKEILIQDNINQAEHNEEESLTTNPNYIYMAKKGNF